MELTGLCLFLLYAHKKMLYNDPEENMSTPIYDSCNWDPQFGQIVAEAPTKCSHFALQFKLHVTTSQLLLI